MVKLKGTSIGCNTSAHNIIDWFSTLEREFASYQYFLEFDPLKPSACSGLHEAKAMSIERSARIARMTHSHQRKQT